MVCEHDNEYLKLRIILKDVVGKYRVYRDGNKSMSFILDGDSLFKVGDIFTYIAEKINTSFDASIYESKGEDYLKTKINNDTCLKEDGKSIVTPKEDVKYTCGALLQMQSIFFNMKDKENDIQNCPQVLLEQYAYKNFINNTIFGPDLEFTDTELDSNSESEEEVNENTVLDE